MPLVERHEPISGPAIVAGRLAALPSAAGALLGLLSLLAPGAFQTARHRNHAFAAILIGTCSAGFLLTTFTGIVATSGASIHPDVGRCESNLRRLGVCLDHYAESHRGCFPRADRWASELSGTHGIASEHHFGAEFRAHEYGFNRRLGGLRRSDVKHPHETVLLFDAMPGPNAAGGPELLPPGRHSDGSDVVMFVDGLCEHLGPDRARRANFDPTR
jgi:hypothetical protein